MKSRTVFLATTVALALGGTACGSSNDDGGKTASSGGPQLVKNGTLSVCSDVPFAPFEDFDKSSPTGFKGFDVDIVTEIAERNKLKLAIQKTGFDALQSGQALSAGQCDLIASAMTITEDRKANLDFSDGYYDSKQSLLVPAGSDIAGIADLDGVKVGVQSETTGKAYAEEKAGNASIVSFPTDAEMFQAIKAGQVEALLQDLPVNLGHTADGKFKVIETYDTGEEYGLAMKKGNSELVETVNSALKKMRSDGTYDKLYEQYFSTDK